MAFPGYKEKIDELIEEAQKYIDDQYRSIAEIAMSYRRSRQAIYINLIKGRLAGEKIGGKWRIHVRAAQEWSKSRYIRPSHGEGFYDVRQAAKRLKVPLQRVYYCLRSGKMKYTQVGKRFKISEDTIVQYEELMKSWRRKRQKRLIK